MDIRAAFELYKVNKRSHALSNEGKICVSALYNASELWKHGEKIVWPPIYNLYNEEGGVCISNPVLFMCLSLICY